MTRLEIDGMTCQHCAGHVRKALEAVPGVTAVAVDLAAKAATVEGSASLEALVAAVEEEGYGARLHG